MCLAIPAKVVELFPDELYPHAGRALVEVGGVRRQINTGLLLDDPPQTGDWVLVHVGFAMSKISAADAEEQMRTLTLLGEQQAAMEEVQGYGLNGSS
jgi:hydrogenase expression/formation protein HypC